MSDKENVMLEQAVAPPEIMASVLGPELPSTRAADLDSIVSVKMKDLFPDIPESIYVQGEDVSPLSRHTVKALEDVDMSMIKPGDSVNLLCSEHGFSILEGKPYTEMLKTIREEVIERTGCENIRLRLCVGSGMVEAREMIPHFKLDEYFNGKASGTGPFDKGVAIETEIGTLYGLARVYDADWIIHAHYDDPREVYIHRLIYRTLKSFTMSYARHETRSIFHMNFGTRSSNIVPRAIFESPFVQGKFAFTSFLMTSPSGIIGIGADNDLHRLNRKLTASTLRSFGKLMRLFAGIDECIAVLDAGRWPWYLHAGGLTSGNLFKAPTDYLDLDDGPRMRNKKKGVNPAVKALVVNHSWREAFGGLAARYPTVLASSRVAEGMPKRVAKTATIAENLERAMKIAEDLAGTEKAMIFDGSYGSMNLSPSLGAYLIEKAPEVSRQVDEELLPKWLKQRGIDPNAV